MLIIPSQYGNISTLLSQLTGSSTSTNHTELDAQLIIEGIRKSLSSASTLTAIGSENGNEKLDVARESDQASHADATHLAVAPSSSRPARAPSLSRPTFAAPRANTKTNATVTTSTPRSTTVPVPPATTASVDNSSVNKSLLNSSLDYGSKNTTGSNTSLGETDGIPDNQSEFGVHALADGRAPLPEVSLPTLSLTSSEEKRTVSNKSRYRSTIRTILSTNKEGTTDLKSKNFSDYRSQSDLPVSTGTQTSSAKDQIIANMKNGKDKKNENKGEEGEQADEDTAQKPASKLSTVTGLPVSEASKNKPNEDAVKRSDSKDTFSSKNVLSKNTSLPSKKRTITDIRNLLKYQQQRLSRKSSYSSSGYMGSKKSDDGLTDTKGVAESVIQEDFDPIPAILRGPVANFFNSIRKPPPPLATETGSFSDSLGLGFSEHVISEGNGSPRDLAALSQSMSMSTMEEFNTAALPLLSMSWEMFLDVVTSNKLEMMLPLTVFIDKSFACDDLSQRPKVSVDEDNNSPEANSLIPTCKARSVCYFRRGGMVFKSNGQTASDVKRLFMQVLKGEKAADEFDSVPSHWLSSEVYSSVKAEMPDTSDNANDAVDAIVAVLNRPDGSRVKLTAAALDTLITSGMTELTFPGTFLQTYVYHTKRAETRFVDAAIRGVLANKGSGITDITLYDVKFGLTGQVGVTTPTLLRADSVVYKGVVENLNKLALYLHTSHGFVCRNLIVDFALDNVGEIWLQKIQKCQYTLNVSMNRGTRAPDFTRLAASLTSTLICSVIKKNFNLPFSVPIPSHPIPASITSPHTNIKNPSQRESTEIIDVSATGTALQKHLRLTKSTNQSHGMLSI